MFPQFAEQDNHGFMQQDAEECLTQIIHAISEKVKGLTEQGESNKEVKFVDQFMTMELISELKCNDAPEEQPTISIDLSSKLRVNIGSGVSTYMVSDIENVF